MFSFSKKIAIFLSRSILTYLIVSGVFLEKIGSAYSTPLPLTHEWLGGSFCCFFLHNRTMNILQRIFTDYYEEIKYTLHPRNTELENIDKIINCGDSSFGGTMYACPHCGKLKFVPFRRHSRFCPTCGNKYSMERTTSMSFKLLNVRHVIVFSPLMKIFVTSFSKIVPFLTVFFTLSPVLFHVCFSP